MLNKILSILLTFSLVIFSLIYISSNASKKFVVVVDAGHGGYDYGAIYSKVIEKNVNLDIATKLGASLTNAGIQVIYTRTTDTFIPLPRRAEIANNAKADLFISIHSNAWLNNTSRRGTETLYSVPKGGTQNILNGKYVAQIVQNNLTKSLGTRNRGIIYRPNLAVLRRTSMPAVICEIGYLTNISDRNLLSSPNFRQKTANALSVAVQKIKSEFIKIKPTSTPIATFTPTPLVILTPLPSNPQTSTPMNTPKSSDSNVPLIDYSTLQLPNNTPVINSFVNLLKDLKKFFNSIDVSKYSIYSTPRTLK